MKICCGCKEEKSLDDFGIRKTNKDGKDTYCKICKTAQVKKSYEKRREKILEKCAEKRKGPQGAALREAERIRYWSGYRDYKIEYKREYRKNNKDKIKKHNLAQRKIYYNKYKEDNAKKCPVINCDTLVYFFHKNSTGLCAKHAIIKSYHPDLSLDELGSFVSFNDDRVKLRKWGKEIKKRDNLMCQICYTSNNLHAHHIKPKSLFPDLAYDIDNGITLCDNCHYEVHHGGITLPAANLK